MPLGPEFNTGGPVRIAVINEAKTPLGVDLGAMVKALQTQVTRDFEPRWGLDCTLYTTATPDPSDWQFVFLDDSDQEGALGYHDLTEAGLPVMKVFVKDTVADGDPVSTTASHELLETLADPATNVLRMDARGTIYIQEVADPCEADSYMIDGVPMSNFVFPSWFEPFHQPNSTSFDQLGKLNQPFQLDPGGYISILRRNRWTQIFGSRPAEERFAKNRHRKHRLALLKRRIPIL